MPVLTGEQLDQLEHLLTEGFDKDAIAELVRKHLGHRLETIVNPHQDTPHIVFDLLTWIDRKGLSILEVFLQGALAERPADGALHAFCEQIITGALKPVELQPSPARGASVKPTVKLRLGDLFDGPADLIVLPCSTSGTITGFVARRLAQYSIPHPRGGMVLGDVEVMPFEGADDIAQFVAFAASVHGLSSSQKAIESIGRALGNFTDTNPAVKYVAAPLLGAGAGGIQSELVATALREGFSATAAPDATLAIHVLHQEVYDRLKENRRIIQGGPKDTIRVFISHTSKSDEAVEWVKALALYLIDQGIQARLDRFHLRRGMDLQQWMCNELAMARKVIVVCDEAYKQKADGRLGGVGWETMIIQGDMASLPPDSTKYQVVVRAPELEKGLPLYLKTRYVFHAPDKAHDKAFSEELVKELLDVPIDPTLQTREFAL